MFARALLMKPETWIANFIVSLKRHEWVWSDDFVNPFAAIPDDAKNLEKNLYKPFSDIINGEDLCPGYELRIVDATPEMGESNRLKVDAALFPKSRNLPDHRRPYWAYQSTSFEFKKSVASDPFDDAHSWARDAGPNKETSASDKEAATAEKPITFPRGHNPLIVEERWSEDDYGIDVHQLETKATNVKASTVAEGSTRPGSKRTHASRVASKETSQPRVAVSAAEAEAIDRQNTRTQLISYARLMFSRQHREFGFTVLIMGDYARIIRWDRSGAIVTERFNYKKTDILLRFLRGFSQMTLAEQGIDTTAEEVMPGTADFVAMQKAAEDPSAGTPYAVQAFKKSLNVNGHALWKLRVTPESRVKDQGEGDAAHKPKDRHYLVGKPHFEAFCMAGRATRGYVALNCETLKLVFLKDAWRVDAEGIDKEGHVLEELNRAGVRNIPHLECHGDVDGQATLTQALSPNPSIPLKAHKHYRLVVEEVCRPLEDFDDGRELTWFILCCLDAHQDAVEKAGIMHRDISYGNILIYENPGLPKRTALLCDWELSKRIVLANSDLEEHARQPDRTGTWQFMSVLALDNPAKVIEIPDELESIFNVWLHHSVRYCHSNLSYQAAVSFLKGYYDGFEINPDTNQWKCGLVKRKVIETGRLAWQDEDVLFFNDANLPKHPINVAFDNLLQWFNARYLLSKENSPVAQTTSAESPLDAMEQLEQEKLRGKQDDVAKWTHLANKLTDHKETYRIVQVLYNLENRWPKNDKVGDKVKLAKAETKKRKYTVQDYGDGEGSSRDGKRARSSQTPAIVAVNADGE